MHLIARFCLVVGLIGCAEPFASGQHAETSAPAEPQLITVRGFLFVNGRYISSPYQIRWDANSVYMNEIDLTSEGIDLSDYSRQRREKPRRFAGRQRGADRSPTLPLKECATDLYNNLNWRGILVLRENEKPIVLDNVREGHDFLELLCGTEQRSVNHTKYLSSYIQKKNLDQDSWQRWIDTFEATPLLLTRAREEIQSVNDSIEAAEAESSKFLWQERLAYPLTVLGMILVVLSFGHLLSQRPELTTKDQEAGVSPEQDRAIRRSLTLVFAFSALDLIWTLIASQLGTMREINPLGHNLIHDPVGLVAFKLSVTAFAIGLLYALRRLPLAQHATWWACLLLTLLTARWLTFNSMFLA